MPRLLAAPIVVTASTISFTDDIVGDVVNNAFGGVTDINLRDHAEIKRPSRFQSSPFKPSSINSSVLVRLLRIKQEDIGVTICSGNPGGIVPNETGSVVIDDVVIEDDGATASVVMTDIDDVVRGGDGATTDEVMTEADAKVNSLGIQSDSLVGVVMVLLLMLKLRSRA